MYRGPLKVLAIPRDPSPYQELLYGPLRELGVEVSYGAAGTPSHTLNLLLLPVELALRRLVGFRVLHVHWVFLFTFPGAGRSRLMRRLGRLWFTAMLGWAHLLGLRIVWTAHNVLPHGRVFDDDRRARRTLVNHCDLVIVHSPHAIDQLTAIGAAPAHTCVIPHGPMVDSERFKDLPEPGCQNQRTVLFFGQVAPYKGVDELLQAVAGASDQLSVVVAGACRDPRYRDLLISLGTVATGARVQLRLDYIPDAGLTELLTHADVLVFPFREVTTSGSVLLGMAAGRPALIPALPALADLPEGGVIRYTPGVEGLRGALAQVMSLSQPQLAAMGKVARDHALNQSWEHLAARTEVCLREAMGESAS